MYLFIYFFSILLYDFQVFVFVFIILLDVWREQKPVSLLLFARLIQMYGNEKQIFFFLSD